MELYQLEYFRVLCKHGNFTSASEELMVTQPAVSMAVRKLEEEFGTALINRRGKTFAITKTGETVLSHAIAMHNELTSMRRELNANAFKNREVIRIALPLTMCPDLLPKLMSDFALLHDDITLNVLQKGHASISEGLADRTIDVGVLSRDMLNPLLLSRDYRSVQICATFSPEHRFSKLDRVTPEDLSGETLILSKMANRMPGYMQKYFAEYGVKPKCEYHNIFPDGSGKMARQGAGVALVPEPAAGDNSAPLSPPLFCELVVAWNKKDGATQEMMTLIDFISGETGD